MSKRLLSFFRAAPAHASQPGWVVVAKLPSGELLLVPTPEEQRELQGKDARPLPTGVNPYPSAAVGIGFGARERPALFMRAAGRDTLRELALPRRPTFAQRLEGPHPTLDLVFRGHFGVRVLTMKLGLESVDWAVSPADAHVQRWRRAALTTDNAARRALREIVHQLKIELAPPGLADPGTFQENR